MVERFVGREQVLSCFGALSVTMKGDHPVFRSFHHAQERSGHPDTLCELLAQISADRHVILGQAARHNNFWDWSDMLSTGQLFVSSIHRHHDLQPKGMSIVSIPCEVHDEMADRMQLPSLRNKTPARAAHIAPERAALLWLHYVRANLQPNLCDSMFAAYQAWHAIERARPIPF